MRASQVEVRGVGAETKRKAFTVTSRKRIAASKKQYMMRSHIVLPYSSDKISAVVVLQ